MCWDSFFNSPRHSGSKVGNNYVILYTKSRQAGDGRERIVREKQCRLFHDLLKSMFLLKKSTLSFFTVKIPGSRDRKDVWRSQSFCWIAWHLAKNYMTSCCTFDAGLTFWSPRASPALWSDIGCFFPQPQVGLMAHSSTTGCQSVHFAVNLSHMRIW